MAPAQSSPAPFVPPAGTRPRLGDLRWLGWYAGRGLIALVRARAAFARLEARDILARNAVAGAVPTRASRPEDAALVARIAYVIPRISARLPWRSDCVIQAMAAQDWLAAHGLASEIRIGVERPTAGSFGAHAWLIHEGHIVTGGDVSRYELLLGERSDAGGPGGV